jgi:hypothetical protein
MSRRRGALTAFVALIVLSGGVIALRFWSRQAHVPNQRELPDQAHLPNQRELFDQALQAGKNSDQWSYILAEVAKAQAAAGYYEDALTTARLVNEFQDQLFASVLKLKAEADLEGAKKMLSELPSGQIAARAIREVALEEARHGDLDGALRTSGGQFADELKVALGEAQLKAGDLEAALITVNKVQTAGEADDLLYGIARELTKRGKAIQATEIASRITDPQIKTNAIPSPFEKALAENDLNGAANLAREMSPQERCDSLLEVSADLVKVGKHVEAGEILTEVTAEAQKISDEAERARVLGRVAVLQIDSGLPVAALEFLKALPANLTFRVELLGAFPVGAVCDVAWAYARKRKFKEAYDLAITEDCEEGVAIEQYKSGDFQGALGGIKHRPNPSDQSSSLASLAEVSAKTGDIRNAIRFAELVSVPGAYENGEGYLAPALREIGRAWAKSGMVKEGYSWARSRSTAYQRAMALLGIAEAI